MLSEVILILLKRNSTNLPLDGRKMYENTLNTLKTKINLRWNKWLSTNIDNGMNKRSWDVAWIQTNLTMCKHLELLTREWKESDRKFEWAKVIWQHLCKNLVSLSNNQIHHWYFPCWRKRAKHGWTDYWVYFNIVGMGYFSINWSRTGPISFHCLWI